MKNGNPDSIKLHGPLTIVVFEVLHKEGLSEIVEPAVVALQGWTLEPRFPELHFRTGLIAHSTVIVFVGDSRHLASDWH